jgi:phospholipid-binding lipoprotein MlaA
VAASLFLLAALSGEPRAVAAELATSDSDAATTVVEGGRAAPAEPADVAPAPAESVTSAPAPQPEPDIEIGEDASGFPDPYERMNRQTFAFNQTFDGWVVAPLADAYDAIFPSFVRTGVRNFFANLSTPALLVNNLLQGNVGEAGTTLARFAINTVSSAGLVDTASYVGLEGHNADFGETLALSGVSSGPYIVVPLLGPTTARDGIGTIVDVALNPTLYIFPPITPLTMASIQTGAYGFTERAAHGGDLRELQATSVDYYAALRSAYSQQRMAQTGERREASQPPPT